MLDPPRGAGYILFALLGEVTRLKDCFISTGRFLFVILPLFLVKNILCSNTQNIQPSVVVIFQSKNCCEI